MDFVPVRNVLVCMNDTRGLADFSSALFSLNPDLKVYASDSNSAYFKDRDASFFSSQDLRPGVIHSDLYGMISRLYDGGFDLVVADLPGHPGSLQDISIYPHALLRLSGKMFGSCASVADPGQYGPLLMMLEKGKYKTGVASLSLDDRLLMASAVFKSTSGYDRCIARYIESQPVAGGDVPVSSVIFSLNSSSVSPEHVDDLKRNSVKLIDSDGQGCLEGGRAVDLRSLFGLGDVSQGLVRLHPSVLLSLMGSHGEVVDMLCADLPHVMPYCVSSRSEAQKLVDVGTVAMIRSAASNHRRAVVLSAELHHYLLSDKIFSSQSRYDLAVGAFFAVADYDARISRLFDGLLKN
ncbi:hypothetical protein JW968_05710 [Candidatus Woesearchaeota archaeon]|nr:hypothetical protein [Candidatus Woesearchaeota archaeon]